MSNEIKIYNNGVVHRDGDPMQIRVIPERKPDGATTNQHEIWVESRKDPTDKQLVCKVASNLINDHNFLTHIYGGAVIYELKKLEKKQ